MQETFPSSCANQGTNRDKRPASLDSTPKDAPLPLVEGDMPAHGYRPSCGFYRGREAAHFDAGAATFRSHPPCKWDFQHKGT